MKKIKQVFFILILLSLVLLPAYGLAAEERAGEQIIVGGSEVVNDDLYIAGGEVMVEGTVIGDLYVAGGTVNITGEVTGDVLVFAGTFILSGQVGDDLRIGAGDVRISGQVGDEILVGSGTMSILDNAKVNGSIMAGVGNLSISGQTESIRAQVGTLNVNPTAKINGNLEYWSNSEANIATDSTIIGETTFNQVEEVASYYKDLNVPGKIYSLLTSILIALLFVYFLPKHSVQLANLWREKAGINFIWGLLFLIVAPIIVLLLMFLVLTIPLSIGLIMVYTILVYLATIVAIVGLGYCIQKYFDDRKLKKPDWISVIIGALVYYLVSLVPFVGSLVVFILWMIGLGALVSYKFSWLKDLKKKGKI
jgi:cytoskeletal protein CcmA (bactofilin family)